MTGRTRSAFKPYGFDYDTSPYIRVAHLASYITDDQCIANYEGCDRQFVAKVRSELPRNTPVRFNPNRNERYGEGGNSSSGRFQDASARENAEYASKRLCERMWKVFDAHARQYRLTPYEAAVCLQNCTVRV